LAIHRIHDDLFLVDLDLPVSGFTQFIGSWIMNDGDRALIIDPGPSAAIGTLLDCLRELGINKIDHILLTHIHLDHAGGCGDLVRSYPDAEIVCHPRAVGHLADPERLWQGSLKVLGDLARAYGQPSPIDEKRIRPDTDVVWKGSPIISVETPGHAVHHLCFFYKNLVFAGEVAGVSIPTGNDPYLRPAAPPPFKPDTALRSISLVAERRPEIICYGHYGLRKNATELLHMAHDQIQFWLSVIKQRQDKDLDMDEGDIFGEILAKDPRLSAFYHLDPETRERELYFCKNTIKGMLGSITA
jgi:glyoxylase-like metal-dependent hydrolase (beta-lactamase superfamily II)